MDSHNTDPGFKTRRVRCNYYQAFDRLTASKHVMVCVKGQQRISQKGLTQDNKTGSCVFQCVVPQQWIEQQQVYPGRCDMNLDVKVTVNPNKQTYFYFLV